jgi:hypothetical protein
MQREVETVSSLPKKRALALNAAAERVLVEPIVTDAVGRKVCVGVGNASIAAAANHALAVMAAVWRRGLIRPPLARRQQFAFGRRPITISLLGH